MRQGLIFTILFLMLNCFAFAQTVERLSDKEVKQIIDNVEKGRDRFEDALDDKLKRSVYRGPRGEVDITKYLDDFQENVKSLKERFTKEYSASSEAAVVLEKATNMGNFIQDHPGTKGASEFEHFAVDLKSLARAYSTDFPLPEGAPVRRINDKEAAMAADSLAKQADQLKKQIDKDKTLPKEQKETYEQDIEQLKKSAKTLKSRLSDSKPSAVEARTLMDQASQIGQSLEGSQMSPQVTSAWNAMQSSLDKLAQAFGQ